MIYVYNEIGLNDTLLCIANKKGDSQIKYITVSDVVQIVGSGKLIGYNIKNISKYIDVPFTGTLLEENKNFNQKIVKIIEAAFPQWGGDKQSIKQAFVVGHVMSCTPHPDSQKLSVCEVDVGDQILQIVCGAKNVAKNQLVVVAKIGSIMPSGLLIEPGILRKELSNGMICSAKELNLPVELQNPGILVLPQGAEIGTAFFKYYNKEMKK
ncbi:MAG: YtpR family tRNA-binding protein [Culicoidibacterales bacterium]